MIRLAWLLGLATLLAVAAASAAMIVRHASTKTYALTLRVGPIEAMYRPAEVKAKHRAER
jgi:hypothetical protein